MNGVRLATMQDAERIIELGRTFLAAGPYRDEIEDNPEQVHRLIAMLFATEQARILVYEEDGIVVGVFCFIIYPHYFSGLPTGNEVIWYVDPAHRGKASLELLWAAERMAADMGAVRMQLTAPTEEVGEIYKRCKYHQVEVGYQALLSERVRPSCQQSQRV